MPGSLNFIADPEALLRQDQIILRQLWEAIKRASDFFDDGDLKVIDNEEPLQVRGTEVFWYDEHLTDDESQVYLVAAFLALRGRVDLIYRDQDHYDQVKWQEQKEEEEELAESDEEEGS